MSIYLTELPWPPTMNHRHIVIGGMMRKNPDHRKFEANLRLLLRRKFLNKFHPNFVGKKLVVTIFYEGPKSQWFKKNGEIKKVDCDNRHKNLLDVVFPFFDLDDSQMFELNIKKIARDCLKETTASVLIEEVEE